MAAINSSPRLYLIWRKLFVIGNLDAISLICIPIFGCRTTFINGEAAWCQLLDPSFHLTKVDGQGKKNIHIIEKLIRCLCKMLKSLPAIYRQFCCLLHFVKLSDTFWVRTFVKIVSLGFVLIFTCHLICLN